MNKDSELIYHGSYMEIEFPVIRKHKFTKDFSWGFYCTKFQEQAEDSASRFNTSIVNVYEVNNIDTLNIKKFKNYNDEWLDFVVSCRNGKIHNYDVVIGPMADDSIYDYIEAYFNGQMNKQKFFELMTLRHSTHQISFHSIKALDCINFIKSYQI
ncbi:Protein of unknown function [Clostridium sp. DSM 8431]|uniref:DUF3990 domain-containing protein n=1 Tax=Clostridium sp. DSM 8431 TaxID=1761781 RepID=UPI0008F0BFC0|nr:DUF3990 domain-containing protein [Clostridium sp. DSM 8431]SFU89041.1 Protein of unknown function [Clostridium sp. DSM 8431]